MRLSAATLLLSAALHSQPAEYNALYQNHSPVFTKEPNAFLVESVRNRKPGGAVVVEDRHLDTKRVWLAGTFRDNELLSLFPGLRVLKYEDLWARPDWSAKKVDERLVRLLAEKPQPQPAGCQWEGKTIEEGATACWETVVLRCQADAGNSPAKSANPNCQ